MRVAVVGAVLCVWAGPAAGQAVVDAGAPVRRASEGLTSIFAAAELPDGRVLVVDNREPTIAVMEADGRLRRLGREGPGPEEYSLPTSILRQPDGTFHVYDARNARYSVVSAEGRITGTAPLVRPELSAFSAPRGPDAEGFIYFDWRTFEPDRGVLRDGRIYRWHAGRRVLEEASALHIHGADESNRGVVAFPHGDAWSVTPNGRVIRIVAEDYHVEWKDGATWQRGPRISFEPVRVTEGEREAYMEANWSRPGAGGTMQGPPSRDTRSSRETGSVRIHFPETLPAFERGYLPSAPDGTLWIARRGPHDATHTEIDVIDVDGRRSRIVRVPGRVRVVGFGSNAVFLAVRDEFDQEWLTVYSR